MLKKLLIVCAVLVFAATMFAVANAEGEKEVKHEYVGVDKCKMCHKKDGTFAGWEATAHATAFDKLDDAGKANKECAPCHTTGTTAEGELLKGVQCEGCHGPGSDFKKKSVMEDKEAAIAAGLIIPTEETCKTCHAAKAYPEGHKAMPEFKFDEMVKKGVHPMPAKEEG